MWPYWVFFLALILPALVTRAQHVGSLDGTPRPALPASWIAVVIAMTAIVGFRYEVGGDWGSYTDWFDHLVGERVTHAALLGDPGYQVLNVISRQMGWGVTGVNVVSALFFSIGLAVFCRSLPRPWVAVLAAVPYLVIVIAMGYTRQSVGIGFELLALVQACRRKYFRAAMYIFIGTLFHKTLIVTLFLVISCIRKENRVFYLILLTCVFSLLYLMFLRHALDVLLLSYIVEEMQSAGAPYRLLMIALPAVIFLVTRQRLEINPAERSLWTVGSIGCLIAGAAYLVTPYSTAIDRVALYLLPIQLFVASHIHDALKARGRLEQTVTLTIILLYSLALFVWLNYAVLAPSWIPYKIGFQK